MTSAVKQYAETGQISGQKTLAAAAGGAVTGAITGGMTQPFKNRDGSINCQASIGPASWVGLNVVAHGAGAGAGAALESYLSGQPIDSDDLAMAMLSGGMSGGASAAQHWRTNRVCFAARPRGRLANSVGADRYRPRSPA